MEPLKIESSAGKSAGVRILRLSGALTLKDVFEFQSVVRGVTDPVLIIDISGVPYMDSASLGSIVSVHTTCQRENRRYALVGANERIGALFVVGAVDKILITYPTLEQAEEALTRKATAP
jgi:anti-sigma B factor antagonist